MSNYESGMEMTPGATINTPAQWAAAQLQFMGLPTTQQNIDFLVSWAAMEGGNWNNTARYNPLNTTLRYNGSTVMSGGNTAGVQAYSSWQDGLTATAQTLNGYPEIMRALESGDAEQANQSGQLANDFSRWSGGGYTQIGSNTGYATQATTPNQSGGGTVTQQGATGTPTQGGQPLTMSDIPAVQQYIRQNFGTDAWLLDIPDVASVLEQAVVNGESAAQIQARIEQTNWWNTTSQAVKNYEQQSKTNPAEYSFTIPGSQASQTLAQIQSVAAQAGVQLDLPTAQTLAQNALKFGWNNQQIQQAIGSRVQYNGQGTGNAGGVVQQLKAMAGQYYMNLTPQALQSWAQNIAAGTQTIQQFQAQMQQDASLKWTGFASQLSQGNSMVQLTDSLRNEAAKTMEVDPSSIDFVNNPVYQKILDYVPPDSQNGVHRVMTLSEMDQYLKSQPSWGYTQQARDQAAQLEQTISSTWGRIAS